MNLRWPLSRRILGVSILNLLLIVISVVAFIEWQFGLSLESLLLGPASDRITVIADSVQRDLQTAPFESRAELLAEYSMRYRVQFLLVSPQGESLSGAPASLPEALIPKLRGRGQESRPLDGRGTGSGRGPEEGRGPQEGRGPEFAEFGRGPDGRGVPPPGGPFHPESARGRGGPPGAQMTTTTFLNVTHNPLTFWVGVRMPIAGSDGRAGYPAVLLLRTNSVFNNRLFFDWRALLVLAAVLVAIALACWWPLVHGVTASIGEMQRVTAEIAQGRFDRHVNLTRSDELGRLAQQIDAMAEQLEALVKYQKRFLGDIAHELCAPVARIQFALGILEQRLDEAHQTHVSVLREEIQQMSDLVNELLMFSKAGVQTAEAPLKWMELRPAVERAVAHQLPGLGTIQVAVDPQSAVLAHEPFLVRAISNLLRNALRYAGNDGPILVKSWREGANVVLSVRDCGPGVPEESLEEIFVPFYRPENARSRDTGGAGLGLAIVKSCVEACRGTVTCRNREPSGLEVLIRLEGKTA